MVSLDALINNLDEAILLFDRTGKLSFINKHGEEFLSKSYKEIKRRHFKRLFSDAREIVMLLHKTITEGRSFNCKEMEIDIGGRVANIDLNLTPFYEESSTYAHGGVPEKSYDFSGCNGAILCIRENMLLTEREDYQFDSLLYLLGCIAHEIKNPLSGIKGAAQILMTKPSIVNHLDAEDSVELILKETDRLNSVLHSYLTMTRRPVFNRLNIHEVIEYALKVMKTSIEERRIYINKSYDPSLPDIVGDESKLLQVFINLFKNAVEAMRTSKNRILSVSTKPSNEYMVTYKEDQKLSEGSSKDLTIFRGASEQKSRFPIKQRWVVVEIKDTGIGISKDEIGKIFLPFYTKKTGGSGLGLALSKKIIKDHCGIIKVKSKIGAGTIFSIYLPMKEQKGFVDE
ncbi:PAS domain-containing sensor histidine kinase [hot springs metagenome]|uniref:PAS domain-containing sensor histidine kinase n=1 Tax=hot springs metagenome TaxID=433727 RepID=A0A5J4KWZ9_9ZZZZ